MKSYGLTDVGMCRTENEDAFALFSTPDLDGSVCVLCDGMGGEAGGKLAATLCVEHITETLKGKRSLQEQDLIRALFEANALVLERAKASEGAHARMGTTLLLVLATPTLLTLLWVGDSRAYLLQKDQLRPLTHDHSYVQTLIDDGKLTAGQARNHPRRNFITRAVGVAETVKCDTVFVPWSEGDRLLLCTDGLYTMLEENELKEILSEDISLGLMAHELVCAANSHGGEDNITALLLENTKEISPNA